MTQFNYRNINEMILDDLLSSGFLDISENDDDELIEDVICKTLNSVPSLYIRHHIDFSYSQSDNEKNDRIDNIKNIFNDSIQLFRGQDLNRRWE